MESMLCLIAMLSVWYSHNRGGREKPPPIHIPPTGQTEREGSWTALIIVALFLIVLHFVAL